METPVVSLDTDKERENVYEPSEDSFLLIDALEMDLKDIKCREPLICMEIGVGSGVVITALAMALKKYCAPHFLGIDINPEACQLTRKTSTANDVNIDVVQMDLLTALCKRNVFDLILFNPPYVVTEPSEIMGDDLISKAWAGGEKGRQVMDRVFPIIPDLLSRTGLFYLLLIKENEPHAIIDYFKNLNISGHIVNERKIRGEHLFVLRFEKER
ncbi:hypothetical protein QAD02_019762 [Eretmocerus hayati]|uniref:Uncharacterized protein n=1 Tax=Eretmocerus hayati TaxID=131215 RepID=A0ACC2PQB2_9HYME|nr:hypothetical protein QAD02_019762 [Eretmocerus hayati]